MPIVKVICDGKERIISACKGIKLSELLTDNGAYVEHLCGGKGSCKKCTVYVDGKSELSCLYTVERDITVRIPDRSEMISVSGAKESGELTKNLCLCLDIGTTTLALALVSLDGKQIIKVLTKTNPQRAFGADVISRIDFCTKNGVQSLFEAVRDAVNEMIDEMMKLYMLSAISEMFVSGNATMLHIFFGVDCSSMGVAPYTPSFTDEKSVKGESLGINKIDTVRSLPSISAFVGADIVAGMNYIGVPPENKYSLLVDLGTNAEVVLFNEDRAYATAAAAGPCFEGANISCGMSAVNGAISVYHSDGSYEVIGDNEPSGLCATGLVDLIAYLVKNEIIDESGFMEDEEFRVAESVTLTQKDVREFQLAKSAVLSAVICLIKRAKITFDDINALYVAGGFSASIDSSNAAFVGLVPKEMLDKLVPVNNSSLLGTVKYSIEKNDLAVFTQNSEYVDLSKDPMFSELFFENMVF